jgi:hypothetical protein
MSLYDQKVSYDDINHDPSYNSDSDGDGSNGSRDNSPADGERGDDNHSSDDRLTPCGNQWILNSKTPTQFLGEKFTFTFIEASFIKRRVVVSADYRNAPVGTILYDVQTITCWKRRAYKLLNDITSHLPGIQWYDTVTTIEMSCQEGLQYLQYKEDPDDIVSYPPIRVFGHIEVPQFHEPDVEIVSHLSDFSYTVCVQGKILVMKSIHNQRSEEEFTVKIEALSRLISDSNITKLEGLVVTQDGLSVTGILMTYAEQGSLEQLLKGDQVGLERRKMWAMQSIVGLVRIHESGLVHGNFVISNILIDNNGDVRISNILGREMSEVPPELTSLVSSGLNFCPYVGVKTDVWQLGTLIWAIIGHLKGPWRSVVSACMEHDPRCRPTAKDVAIKLIMVGQRCRPDADFG